MSYPMSALHSSFMKLEGLYFLGYSRENFCFQLYEFFYYLMYNYKSYKSFNVFLKVSTRKKSDYVYEMINPL